jgi:hypothetical protein
MTRSAIAIAVLALAAAASVRAESTPASAALTARAPLAITAVVFRGGTTLLPGVSQQVDVTLANNSTHRMRLDGSRIRGRVSNLPPRCQPSWFSFTGHAGPVVVVPANGGAATVRGTLTFTDAPVDQSACAGAAPALSLHVS